MVDADDKVMTDLERQMARHREYLDGLKKLHGLSEPEAVYLMELQIKGESNGPG